MDNPFKKPHPFIYNAGSVLIPGFIAFLLLFVFAPLGFNSLDLSSRLFLAVTFWVISSIGVLLIIGLLRRIVPGFMQEENWTVGKELVLILTVIAGICLLNFAVILILRLSEMPVLSLFQQVVLYTLGISIIPVGVLVLFEQLTHQNKKLKQAQRLNKELRRQTVRKKRDSIPAKNPVIFEADNGKVELQLQTPEIIYLNSSGNYVEICYQDNDQKKHKKLIRNRLKRFVTVLPEGVFFQCHKSYIINTQHIVRVEGNARNLELIMRGTDLRIPVSRSKSEALSEFLKVS